MINKLFVKKQKKKEEKSNLQLERDTTKRTLV